MPRARYLQVAAVLRDESERQLSERATNSWRKFFKRMGWDAPSTAEKDPVWLTFQDAMNPGSPPFEWRASQVESDLRYCCDFAVLHAV